MNAIGLDKYAKVEIKPISKVRIFQGQTRAWVVRVAHENPPHFKSPGKKRESLIVGYFRTRALARQKAALLRQALAI